MKLSSALIREPLLQFLVLGAVLFGVFNLFGKKEAEAPSKIVISAERKTNLADGFARTWRRQPTEEELSGLIDDYIRDEVFYREGKAAALDRDDTIIRRRVRQKMEFIVEDMVAAEPSEQDLASHLVAHPERFRTEDRFTFRQIFLSKAKRNATLNADAQRIAITLTSSNVGADTASLGDPFIPGEEFTREGTDNVTRIFGDDFAKKIAGVPPGGWQGPIVSSFGQHFVFVSERIRGELPPLDSIRQAVRQDWSNINRAEAVQKLYDTLRARYEIEIEAQPAAPIRVSK